MAWDDYTPVLTDDEEEQRRRGAPVDFPGVVLPNPNNIRPMADTDAPPVEPLTSGAKMSTKNFDGHRTGDTSSGKQLWPDVQMHEIGASSPASPYPAVGSTEDLESRAARPRVARPVESLPAVGSTEDLERRAARPRTAIQDAQATETPRPQWKDYAPAKATTWQRVKDAISPGRPEVEREKAAKEAYKNAVGEYEAPLGEEKTKVETEQKQSQAELERAQAHAAKNPADWKAQPGWTNNQGQPLELNEKTGEFRWGNVEGGKTIKTPSETATQHELDMENIGAKIGFSGDPKKVQQEINAAVASGKITQDQANDYVSHRMLKGDTGTKVTVPVEVHAGNEATDLDKYFTGKEVVVHTKDGRRVQMSYGEAQKSGIPREEWTVLNAKEAQDNRDKFASVSTTMDHVKRYRNDFKTLAPQLTNTDRAALGVLSSHSDKVADSFLGVTESGIIDTLIGKPLTGYSEKLMGAWMTKDQYDHMSPQGKQMMADYMSTVLANFANLKAVQGSIPRNPAIIKAEMARVPMPFLDWGSASPAFDNFRDDIRGRSGSLPEIQ